ncbi:MAG: hypothetical protein WCR42_02045 [bacterium]
MKIINKLFAKKLGKRGLPNFDYYKKYNRRGDTLCKSDDFSLALMEYRLALLIKENDFVTLEKMCNIVFKYHLESIIWNESTMSEYNDLYEGGRYSEAWNFAQMNLLGGYYFESIFKNLGELFYYLNQYVYSIACFSLYLELSLLKTDKDDILSKLEYLHNNTNYKYSTKLYDSIYGYQIT